MKKVKINDVSVNLEAFKDFKSLAELKKEPGNIFGHLPQNDQAEAYKELFDVLNQKEQKVEPEAGAPAVS